MSCPSTPTCPLFPLFTMRSSLAVWRTNYCDAGYQRCERFKLKQASRPVAPNLLPNGRLLDVAPRPGEHA